MPRRGTKVRRAGDGVCCFCCIGDERELELGKLHRSNNQTVHYYCLLFSSGLPQNGDDDEGIMGFLPADIEKERQRGRKLKCCYCHQPGATIGCSEKLCRRTYHYSCGEQHSAAFKFNSDFRSYCGQHREWQRGLTLALKAEEEEFEFVCPICIEDIPQDPRHMVWAPCCNAFLHKSCIRQLALSAGYFFKCPLCNDKDAFVPEMQDAGIYVPEKDASWELEPNAFSELLERPVHCDATPCKCLDGPKVDEVGTRWEILLCNLCGSSGVHVACGGLPMSCTEWTCPACAKTLEESVRRMQSEVRQRRLSQRNKKMAQSIMSGGNGRAERQSTFHEFRAQSLISAQNQRLETVLKETGSSVHGGTGRQSTMHKFTVSESTTDHTSSLVDLNIHSATHVSYPRL